MNLDVFYSFAFDTGKSYRYIHLPMVYLMEDAGLEAGIRFAPNSDPEAQKHSEN